MFISYCKSAAFYVAPIFPPSQFNISACLHIITGITGNKNARKSKGVKQRSHKQLPAAIGLTGSCVRVFSLVRVFFFPLRLHFYLTTV